MSDDREHQVRKRILDAFDPTPASELEADVRRMVVRPHGTGRRFNYKRMYVALAAAAFVLVVAVVAYRSLGAPSSPSVASSHPRIGQGVLPPAAGVSSTSPALPALQGTPVSSLARARSLADPAIRIPEASVAGHAVRILVWSTAHPNVTVTTALASRERARVAIGVVYASGVVFTAVPLADQAAASRLLSAWRELASRAASETAEVFVDGRAHAGAMTAISGRPTYVEQSGVATRVGHANTESTIAVPSTARWIENGVSYQLSHPILRVADLARIAAATP